MSSLKYLDFINKQVPKETVERNTMVNLMKVKDLIAHYLPSELVQEKKSKMFDTLFGML